MTSIILVFVGFILLCIGLGIGKYAQKRRVINSSYDHKASIGYSFGYLSLIFSSIPCVVAAFGLWIDVVSILRLVLYLILPALVFGIAAIVMGIVNKNKEPIISGVLSFVLILITLIFIALPKTI